MKKNITLLLNQICVVVGFFLIGNVNTFGGGITFSEPKPDLYILSIGINKYATDKMPGLKYARADAETVAADFERRSGRYYNRVNQTVLLDEQASRAGIIAALEKLSLEITPNDVLIFNFAGYGYEISTVQLKEFYLFPADFNYEAIEPTSISNTLLQAYFKKIRAGKKLVILDSCKSASGYRSAESAFIEQDQKIANLVEENILFIGTDTYSKDSPDSGHGTITEIVLNGLKGAADFDGDGVIRTRELEAYIYQGGIEYAVKQKYDFHPRTILQGANFDLADTDKKLAEIAAETAKQNETAKEKKQTKTAPPGSPAADAISTRADIVGEPPKEKTPLRRGADYAVLFANDVYDNAGWRKLKNPQNDAGDIAKELKDRYGFREVKVKPNLTTQEIYDTIESYQNRSFENKEDDQLFIFFAGHGVGDKISDRISNGYYVGRDSPYPFTRKNSGEFVQLDRLLTAVDVIPLEHIMVVFDACYAGQIWQPGIQLIRESVSIPGDEKSKNTVAVFSPFVGSGGMINTLVSFSAGNSSADPQSELAPLAYAKRRMKTRSRNVLTSGDQPVLDVWRKPDGTLSNNSPFADALLQALRTGGGTDKVLTTTKISLFIDKLTPEPQVGKLSGSDGVFVFVNQAGG